MQHCHMTHMNISYASTFMQNLDSLLSNSMKFASVSSFVSLQYCYHNNTNCNCTLRDKAVTLSSGPFLHRRHHQDYKWSERSTALQSYLLHLEAKSECPFSSVNNVLSGRSHTRIRLKCFAVPYQFEV